MKDGFRFLDHTGDFAFEVWAKGLEGLFAQASLAVTEAMVDSASVRSLQSVEWSVKADFLEGLLVRQLTEILFLLETKALVFAEFEIHWKDDFELNCIARGEAFDPDRHGFKTALKAVTYHQLKILQKEDGTFHAQVVLDV